MYDHKEYRTGTGKQRLIYGGHVFLALIASFLVVGGTYGTVVQIKASYDAGQLSKVFSCADNSNTIGV
jgi:hypothetical protein